MEYLNTLFACQSNCANLLIWTSIIGGYLCGSVPYGLLIGKFAGLGDIRKSGSGNIGATNMLRLGGKKLALLTLFADIFKGVLPVIIAGAIAPSYGLIAALAAVFGHLFPIWLKFKGGKGVATSIGVFIGLHLFTGFGVLIAWLLCAVAFRISSLSALISIALAPVFLYVMGQTHLIPVSIIIAALVWVRHQANIRRLVVGTEPRIGRTKSSSNASSKDAA